MTYVIFIGGLTSSGLGATDINNREAIGGIAKEFYSRVYEHYSYSGAWIFTTSQNYFENENNRYFGNNKIKRVFGGKNDDMKIMWVFEPHVAQKNFRPIERPTNYNLYGLNITPGFLHLIPALTSLK